MKSRSKFRKLIPTPSMAIALLALTVAMTGTAWAAAKINGKNIKTGTVTSKQIKNGTIAKADLKKGLSVTGPTGPQGAPGAAGGTDVITRRFVEPNVGNGNFADRDVQCAAGEHLVGGGAGWVELDGDNSLLGAVAVSVPTDSSGDPAGANSVPTGWTAAAQNTTGAARDFYVYAVCAKP